MKEAITPLLSARRQAQASRLGDVLDAYETVCAFGYLPESWRTWTTHLAVYQDSVYFVNSNANAKLNFRSEISLEVYLQQLFDFQLAHLASDAITALFQATAVFAPWQHLEWDVETLCVEVVGWRRDRVSQRQMLVRRCLVTLEHNDLHLLLDGIRREITARDYLKDLRQFSSTIDMWSPSSASHIEILPRLKLKLSDADTTFLGHAVDYVPPMLETTPNVAVTLMQRATSRATSFLASQGRNQGQNHSLIPIREDSRSSPGAHRLHMLLTA
jgi:hypothetical protein